MLFILLLLTLRKKYNLLKIDNRKAREAQLAEQSSEDAEVVSSNLILGSIFLYTTLQINILHSLYSSTVERNTVNILIYVQFILEAASVLTQWLEYYTTDIIM